MMMMMMWMIILIKNIMMMMMMMMVYTTNDMMMIAVDCMAPPQLLSKLSKALSLPIRKSLHYTSFYGDDHSGRNDDDKDKLKVVLFVF